MRTTPVILILFLVTAALLLAGCTQSTPAVQPTILPTAVPTTMAPADSITVMDSSLGKILTGANGMTLYYFTADVPAAGTSACNNGANCSTTWPPFSVDTVVISPPLDAGDFASITRADGRKQTTYYGWPLYNFAKDTKPGDVNGENVIKKWHVVKPDYSVWIASTPTFGSFLTDQNGRTLYFFLKDTTGASTCTGACLTKWPAFTTDATVLPPVLQMSDFSTITRADGVKQSAFMGKPLYYYSGDTGPGMTTGNGFINSWAVANISGTVPVFATPTATPAPGVTTQGIVMGGGY